MSHEHKLAIERIVSLCEKMTNPSRHNERIYDIALESLGLTESQRKIEIQHTRETAIQRYRDREALRRANKTYNQEKENAQ